MATRNQFFKEKRKAPRYLVNQNSAVMMSPAKIVSYRVLNINESGMAFTYMAQGPGNQENICSQLTIFSDNLGLVEVDVRVITDEPVNQLKSINGMLHLRRCGVQFILPSNNEKGTVRRYIADLHSGSS